MRFRRDPRRGMNQTLPSRVTCNHSHESGYAYLMALFLVTVMVILTAAAVPNLLTQGRRDREAETIWRGMQYERGVRLYFHKFGRYPQSVDQLTKQQNGIRFMRQAYKDPMNAADGSWRFIYVTPAGQLIGSVRYTSLAQMAMAERPGGAPPGVLPPGAPGAAPATGGEAQQNSPGDFQMPSGTTPGTPQSPQMGQSAPGPGQAVTPSQPGGIQGLSPASDQPQSLISSGPAFGGSIIGVGSTVEKPSLKVYKGGKTYKQWEFIWNPLAEAAISIQGGAVPGATPVGQPTSGPQNPGQPNAPGQTLQPPPRPQPEQPMPEPGPPEMPEPEPPQS